MNQTASEIYRCRNVEVMAVSDDLAAWKREIKLVWYVGVSFSIIGFALLILTAYIFPIWRKNDESKVWLQKCLASIIFVFFYVTRDFETCKPAVVAITTLYFGLVAFSWLIAGAWLANRRLVTVFGNEKYFMLKSSFFAWLAPLPWILLRLATDLTNFPDILFKEKRVIIQIHSHRVSLIRLLKYVNFLRGFSIYTPVVASIVCSVFFYGRVLFVLWKKRNESRDKQDLCSFAAICFLFSVMSGIQFVIVIVNRFYTFTRQDMFTAFLVTFPVFTNAILFVFGIRSTRKMWINYVRFKLFGVGNNS